jgi:hypothetical protein
MSKIVKCPANGCEVDHFEHIGEESNRVCPECKASVSDEQMSNLEVISNEN